jgi:molybdopterin biosynthesis enzyme
VQAAAETADLVLLNAGSSAGSEDFSARVVEELGELLVHGVAVRPGHPVILGMMRRSGGGHVPIIGVPGYPVSAALTGEIFVEPLLARWLGRPAAPAARDRGRPDPQGHLAGRRRRLYARGGGAGGRACWPRRSRAGPA